MVELSLSRSRQFFLESWKKFGIPPKYSQLYNLPLKLIYPTADVSETLIWEQDFEDALDASVRLTGLLEEPSTSGTIRITDFESAAKEGRIADLERQNSELCRCVAQCPPHKHLQKMAVAFLVFFSAALTVQLFFFFSSRRRHTRCSRDWSSDVCSSD